tara:strand:- start:877 stop:2139 length:1263 start_codon:yes stop_codon:yes gene_type:complete
MSIIADLHLHSKHSRATSKNLDLENLEKYAKLKGIDLLGTGDFCHPIWNKELKAKLTEDDTGILRTKTGFPFMLTNELSLVYTQNEKGRRVHLCVWAPNLEVVDQITEYLLKHGRIDYDGRPIFKITCADFTENLHSISDKIEVIPAHIWTPWFSMFGSKSGFDTVKECFLDQTKHIHAIETGLSSDPSMNHRLSQLDKYQIVSFSDAHSFWPWRLGREATLFDTDLNYTNIVKAIRTGDKLAGTIEVDPNYGKYHYDGHRACNVSFHPQESIKHKGICPVCKKPLVIGVQYRVEELADRPEDYKKPDAKPFHSLIPLSDLIASILGTTVATKKVWAVHDTLTNNTTENNVLLEMSDEDLLKRTDETIAKAIIQNRKGEIKVKAGYDGVYGIPLLEGTKVETPKKVTGPQKGLHEFYGAG